MTLDLDQLRRASIDLMKAASLVDLALQD